MCVFFGAGEWCYRFCVVLYAKLLAGLVTILNNAESLHLDVDLEAGTDLGEARFHRLFQTADEMFRQTT